jgi:hypothetical protein
MAGIAEDSMRKGEAAVATVAVEGEKRAEKEHTVVLIFGIDWLVMRWHIDICIRFLVNKGTKPRTKGIVYHRWEVCHGKTPI